jgi:hypothetical protein
MSNSIWKTPNQKPVNDNDIVIISDKACFIGHFDEFHGFYIRHSSGGIYGTDDIDRWSTLDDLIAQADKAERLQKAVALAVDALKDIQMTYVVHYDNGAIRFRDAKDIAVRAKKEIKQLIKEI